MELTAERLRALLRYNPDTGEFIWRESGSGRTNKVAGRLERNGYVRIEFGSNRNGGKRYSAHRLAYLYMTGRWPIHQMDHINGVRSDNRWENLRSATPTQNQYNRRKSKRNTSGFKGVFRDRGHWRAAIRSAGRLQYLGYFSTAEEAAIAYQDAANRLHGEFARHA